MPYFHPNLILNHQLLLDPVIVVANRQTIHRAQQVAGVTYPNYAVRGLAMLLSDAYGANLAAAPPQPTAVDALNDNDISNMRCPITLVLMRDPVVAADGHTYERAAIATWIDGGNLLSPITRDPITPHALVSNQLLLEVIDAYVLERELAGLAALPRGIEGIDIQSSIGAFYERTKARFAMVAGMAGTGTFSSVAGIDLYSEGHLGEGTATVAAGGSLVIGATVALPIAALITAGDAVVTGATAAASALDSLCSRPGL